MNPGLHVRLALGDPLDAGIGIGERRQLASGHARRGLGGREISEMRLRHGRRSF
jgi:hypothetical protein